MEVVGFIASVAQITSYVISIKELVREIYSKVQSGSRGLDQRLEQLDRVLDTVRVIGKNSLFHTPSIKRHLEAIKAHVESLQNIFIRLKTKELQTAVRKLWNAYTEIRAEKQIFIIFTKLEEEKSTLQLSMTEVNAKLFSRGTFQDQVEIEVNAINDGSAQAQEGQERIRQVDSSQETEPQWPNEATSVMEVQELACRRTGTMAATEESSAIPPFAPRTPLALSGTSPSLQASSSPLSIQPGNLYDSNTCDGPQLNGNVGSCGLQRHEYKKNKVTGHRGQMNGNAADPEFALHFLRTG